MKGQKKRDLGWWVNKVITPILVPVIFAIVAVFFNLSQRVAKLEGQLELLVSVRQTELLKLNQFENQIRELKESIVKSDSIQIPLTAGFQAEWQKGKGQCEIVGQPSKDSLELKANLQGGDSFVELYLDLDSVNLGNIKRNLDNSVNLTGKTLRAFVRSNPDFTGDSGHRNGVQFILKTEREGNIDGAWQGVTPAMNTPSGMEVFFTVPDGNPRSQKITGISLKFTIGSGSTKNFVGSFFIMSMEISS